MKNILLCILFPLLGLSQTNSKLLAAKGFKNYLFGTSPNDYQNLVLEIEEGNTKLYSLNEPGLVIDGVEVEYLRVTFTKNKLSDISIQSRNSTGKKLLQNLRENYGEPTRVNKLKKSYEWKNEKLQLLFESNVAGSDATVSFSNKKAV
jgi:hypothetical protein